MGQEGPVWLGKTGKAQKRTAEKSAVLFFACLSFLALCLLGPANRVPMAGRGVDGFVSGPGLTAVAAVQGHKFCTAPTDIVPVKIAAGLTGFLLFFHGCHLLALLYIILCKMQPLVFNGHHVYTI